MNLKQLFILCTIIQMTLFAKVDLTKEEKNFIKLNPIITLGTDKNWEPYSIENREGTVTGYDVSVLTFINKLTGANFVLKRDRWLKMQDEVKSKKIEGLSTGVINEAQKKYLIFSNPYLVLEKMIFTNINSKNKINTIKDLENKTFAVNKHNPESIRIVKEFNGIKLLKTNNTKETINAVTTGRADAMLGNAAMLYILNKSGNPYLKPSIILEEKPLSLVFSFRKDLPLAVSIVNKALDEIGKQKLLELKKYWFENIKLTSLTLKEKDYIDRKKEIKLCVNPDWMPFEKLDKNGNYIGIGSDYFEIFKKQLEVPINIIKTHSWSQSLKLIKERKCDILPLAMKTPSREKYLNFTVPYVRVPLILVTKNDITFIDSFNQLKGQSVSIVEGFAANEILKIKYPDVNIISVKNAKDGLEKVLSGEVIGFVGSVATVNHTLQKNFMNKIKIAGRFDEFWELSIAIRNDDRVLLEIFEKLINRISLETKQKILNKYISIKYEDRIDYTLILQILFAASIIILIFMYWNRKLFHTKNQIESANKKIENYINIIDANVLVSLSDTNGVITDVSSALCKLTGYTKDELIGKNHNIFRHKDMDFKVFKDMWEIISRGNTWQGELKNLNKDGSSYWADVIISPTHDSMQKVIGYSAIRQNITDKKQLEKISITDSLTNVFNRLYLDRNYDYEAKRAKRYNNDLSIILIDIDFFKNINDTYGHSIGDIILVEMSNILKQNIRNIDKLGRWGGEEFLIICPQTNYKKAEIVADFLRKTISNHTFSNVGKVTCSFGVTKCYADDEKDEAFMRADKALYVAKEEGRNKVIVNS